MGKIAVISLSIALLLGMFLLLYFLDSAIIANGHLYQNIIQNNKYIREIEAKTKHIVTKSDNVHIFHHTYKSWFNLRNEI